MSVSFGRDRVGKTVYSLLAVSHLRTKVVVRVLCQVEVRTTVRTCKQEGSVGLVMVQTCLEHETCLVQEVAVGTLSSFYPSLCVAAIVAFGTKLLTLHLLISG